MLVNMATSNLTSSTRDRVRAWLETSIAQAASPASTILRMSDAISAESGVVSFASRWTPPTLWPTVPSIPQGRPSRSSIQAVMCAVEVFPLVPVIPTVRSFSQGEPSIRAESIPSRRLPSPGMQTIVRPEAPSTGFETTAATAPAARAEST
ncbi:MAG: hypothetical protein BWX47_01919 [candidate division Hyd24-12 bacterium ADurb.Bin004]|nr:MAG: hypothetical protein BWX47_01919 [candidate division Hyd24-12 bacterium ADurb.Bin004]